MDEFTFVCGLLQDYLLQKQSNSMIWALINIKDQAKKTQRPKYPHRKTNQVKILKQPSTAKNANKKPINFGLMQNDFDQLDFERNSFKWTNDRQSETRRIPTINPSEDDDDEFEDEVLRRLEQIQKNMQKLKQQKSKEKKIQSGSTSQPRGSPSVRNQYIYFQQKYIPINKLAENTVENLKPTKHYQHSFPSNSHQAESQQSQGQFSQFSYQPALSIASPHQNARYNGLSCHCCCCMNHQLHHYPLSPPLQYHSGKKEKNMNMTLDRRRNMRKKRQLTLNSSFKD